MYACFILILVNSFCLSLKKKKYIQQIKNVLSTQVVTLMMTKSNGWNIYNLNNVRVHVANFTDPKLFNLPF